MKKTLIFTLIWFGALLTLAHFVRLPVNHVFQNKLYKRPWVGHNFVPGAFLLPQSPDDDGYLMLRKKKKGAGVAGASGSWEFYADGNYAALGTVYPANCSSASSTQCTFSFPTTNANSAFSVSSTTVNNVTISSISWSCSGTWSYPSGAQIADTTNSAYTQTGVNQGNSGGCTSMTITYSGDHGGAQPWTIEAIPPSGTTAVYDTAAQELNSSCTTSCNLPAFSGATALSGTDFVAISLVAVQHTIDGVNSSTGTGLYNGCTSGPYIEDYAAYCVGINLTGSVTGAIANQDVSGYADFTAVAWKTSSSFSVSPSPIWSMTNQALSPTLDGISLSTSPTNMTIASTAGGKAFLVVAVGGVGDELTACSIGATDGSIVSGFTGSLSGVGAVSACLIPSDPSGDTSISLTANASDTYYVGGYEFGKTSGTASLDCANSTTISTAANSLTGPTCSMTGSDDIVFAALAITGTGGSSNECVQTATYLPFPYQAWTNCEGQVYSAAGYFGNVGFALNQSSVKATTYALYDSTTSKAVASVLAIE